MTQRYILSHKRCDSKIKNKSLYDFLNKKKSRLLLALAGIKGIFVSVFYILKKEIRYSMGFILLLLVINGWYISG